MAEKIETAFVKIWDRIVGAVSWDKNRGFGTFGFDKDFLKEGLDLSPLKMSLSEAINLSEPIYEFPNLPKDVFHGLSGLLSDSLPDQFGNEVINSWLAELGREPESFSVIERLCYTGKRGMGALEFEPALHKDIEKSIPVEVSSMMELAHNIHSKRKIFKESIKNKDAIKNILMVGTSAGGSRPKAVIAYNEKTEEVRSGQVKAPKGFSYWLLKFDGVKENNLGDPQGYSNIEYAYSKIAKKCGIKMTECRLLEDGNRNHFMTKRFDRDNQGEKIHTQTMCALDHLSFKNKFSYSYQQAFMILRELKLPYFAIEQLFRRMVFNVVGKNYDDHTKNISFLMNRSGNWSLAPAYDMTYAYNPKGDWTSAHQLSINGKRENIEFSDLSKVAVSNRIKSYKEIIEQITDVFSMWPKIAKDCDVNKDYIDKINNVLNLNLETKKTFNIK